MPSFFQSFYWPTYHDNLKVIIVKKRIFSSFINCWTSRFYIYFSTIQENIRKNPIAFAIRAISVFQVKFNVEFTRQAVNFSIEFPCQAKKMVFE